MKDVKGGLERVILPDSLPNQISCASSPGISHDTLFEGRLHCLQYRQGYRFSIDAVLLAHFTRLRQQDNILDLGAGCGVVSLILSYRWPSVRVVGLEVQDSLVRLCRDNIALNKLAGRLQVIKGDLRQIKRLLAAGSFDQVVCNPPYYKCGSGRDNLEAQQAIARHEIKAELTDILTAAAFALKNRGRATFVFPAERGAVLLAALSRNKLEPKRLQIVYGYPGGKGRLILVEAVRGGGEDLQILPPFYIYDAPHDRQYSAEMAALYLP